MTGPFDLTGRVAIVTGANSGIGLGMALGLAAAGAKIAVVGRSADKNQAAVAKITEAFFLRRVFSHSRSCPEKPVSSSARLPWYSRISAGMKLSGSASPSTMPRTCRPAVIRCSRSKPSRKVRPGISGWAARSDGSRGRPRRAR